MDHLQEAESLIIKAHARKNAGATGKEVRGEFEAASAHALLSIAQLFRELLDREVHTEVTTETDWPEVAKQIAAIRKAGICEHGNPGACTKCQQKEERRRRVEASQRVNEEYL